MEFNALTQQINAIHDQISELEKGLGEILEQVDTDTPMGEPSSQVSFKSIIIK